MRKFIKLQKLNGRTINGYFFIIKKDGEFQVNVEGKVVTRGLLSKDLETKIHHLHFRLLDGKDCRMHNRKLDKALRDYLDLPAPKKFTDLR